jgi:hypothetical protein
LVDKYKKKKKIEKIGKNMEKENGKNKWKK